MTDAYYRVGDVAQRLGCSPASIRLWEREGVVAPRRSAKGHRIYDEDDLTRLRRVYYLRSVEKLNVAAIKKLLDQEPSPTKHAPGEDRQPPLGARLRRLRKERGLTLDQVGALSGLSTSFISGLERGSTGVAVATLRRLLSAYGTTLDALMRVGHSRVGRVTHAARRQRITERFSGVIVEQLTNGPAQMEAQLFSVEPGGGSQGAYAHEGEEFIYVLEGRLNLRLGSRERYRLKPGDCASYPSTLEHEWWNASTVVTRLLWVNTPTTF